MQEQTQLISDLMAAAQAAREKVINEIDNGSYSTQVCLSLKDLGLSAAEVKGAVANAGLAYKPDDVEVLCGQCFINPPIKGYGRKRVIQASTMMQVLAGRGYKVRLM